MALTTKEKATLRALLFEGFVSKTPLMNGSSMIGMKVTKDDATILANKTDDEVRQIIANYIFQKNQAFDAKIAFCDTQKQNIISEKAAFNAENGAE